ncbi:MAG TPA: hypothetical protein VHP81_11970 [Lachnospiraceae bacterium]|nr:hypothetical protein [Lachnospiraceae bacterium]
MRLLIGKSQIKDSKIKDSKIKDSNSTVMFYKEKEAFSGVHKIADKVRCDIERVTDVYPESTQRIENLENYAVIYGTMGQSPVLDDLNQRGLIDLSVLNGKREVYLFSVSGRSFPWCGMRLGDCRK